MAPLALAQRTADSAALAEAASKPVLAGKVDLVEGDVRFFDNNRRRRLPRLGDPLYEGESIATGANGEVHFSMEDGGYIGVRPNTRMRIVSYKAEGGPDDRSVIGLLKGSFRSVTGWIAKLGGNSDMVRTPTATIGVRGTEHEPLVIPEGSKAGEPGTYDRVHLGEAVIRTPQGAVNVRSDQAGFVPQRREPQLDQRGERKPAAEQRQEQRKLRQEQRRRQKTEDERAVEEQRREGLQKQREERREQAQKARLERALKGD